MMKMRWDKALIATLVIAGVVLFVSMPRSLYPGDRNASRIQAILLVTRGELGLPYAERDVLGGFLEQKGQYFFENDAKQRLYSKYGMGYTLFQLPPILVEKAVSKDIPLMGANPSLMPILNGYHILLALIAAAYLYGIAALFTKRKWLRMGFVLTAYFCTFTWNYLRAPAHEILQLVPFVATYYHMMRFLRARSDGQERFRECWAHLLLTTVFLCILVVMKLFFVMFAVVAGVSAIAAGRTGVSFISRIRQNVTKHFLHYVWYMGVPALVGVAAMLTFNHIRFGSVLESGYSQWQPQGVYMVMFKLSRFPEAVKGYFFGTGNHSVWLHNPVFFFALFGFYRFFRRQPACRLFFFLALLVNIGAVCFYVTWGDWCYGPRHMMLWAMIGALPVISFVEWLVESARPRLIAWASGVVMIVAIAWSFQMQMNMNAIQYFAFYYLEPVFRDFKQSNIQQYFDGAFHRGFIHADIIAHNQRKRPFPPVAEAETLILPQYRQQFVMQMNGVLKRLGTSNYFFFE